MAIAFDQCPGTGSSGAAGTTIAKAFAGAVPAGADLFCVAQWASPADTETCTVSDSVNGAWTAIGSPQHDTVNHLSTQNFQFLSSAAGTPTVTATISASVSFRAVLPASWTGVGSVENTPTYNNGNATSAPTPTVTPAVGTDAMIATCAPSDSVTSVATFTMVPGTLSGLGMAYLLNAGTSAVTPTFTKNGSGKYFGSSIILVASATAAVSTLPLLGAG